MAEKKGMNDAARARIRDAGLRCTPARLAVLEHLSVAAGPRTHAEVCESLGNRGFDRATVYRNLTELTEAGLVSRVELGDHVWRFEARRQRHRGGAGDHPHFVCTTCGEVSCLEDVTVAITPRGRGHAARSRSGSRASDPGIHAVTEILLKGLCGDCK
ncbi:MAG: Fur family transcriptional regulator [Pirellulales bacterium]